MTSGRSRALYWFPLVMVLWANLHGGWAIGFVFLGLAFVAEALRLVVDRRDPAAWAHLRRLAVIGAASGLAVLATPHGPGLLLYPFATQGSVAQQSLIVEWFSPDFHRLDLKPFEAMLILLFTGFVLRRPSLYELLLSITVLVAALQSVRHIAIFVATATPLLAWSWSPTLTDLGERSSRLFSRVRPQRLVAAAATGTAVIAVVILVVLRSLLAHQAASTVDNYPSGAADYLDAHPTVGTHMFSDYAWGGYMIYRFYPQPSRRVFLFGEADLMGDTIMNEYVDVTQLHSDWLDILNRHGVDYVVFEPDLALTTALATQPNWHLVYSDKVAVIYVRS